MFLHARRLALMHPVTGGALEFAAPLPDECKVFLEALGSTKPV
jgi:23S rRNA pseudouridine955/2504/2580 synthase